MVKVEILRDIQLEPNGQVFTRDHSAIEYDAKRPINRKWHHLIYKDGDQCHTEFLTHRQLGELRDAGYIRIYQTYKDPSLAHLEHDFRPHGTKL